MSVRGTYLAIVKQHWYILLQQRRDQVVVGLFIVATLNWLETLETLVKSLEKCFEYPTMAAEIESGTSGLRKIAVRLTLMLSRTSDWAI